MLSTSTYSEKENIPLCTYCQKSFANYSNLRHHIQIIHFKENKWDCSKCGKICSSKSNLKVHFRTHIRVRPYACKHCHYNCMHHSSIRDHLMKIHPDKPHTTIEPGYIYNSQSVPEPDQFNSVDFDREKFIESQQKIEPKYFPPEFNLFLPFLPFWPFQLDYPPIPHRQSFDNNEILDLSMHKIKRQKLSTNENTN